MKPPHPVDELAEIQARRRILAAQETALRKRLLASASDTNLVGERFQAHITEFEHGELDRTALEQRFGRAAVAVCVRTVTHRVISLTRRRRGRQQNGSVSVDMTT